MLGPESGFEPGHHVVFDPPRVSDYRASAQDIAAYLKRLLNDADLRRRMGEAGRRRAVEHFDYRLVARRLVEILRWDGSPENGDMTLRFKKPRRAALDVLLHNAPGPYEGLPRTAGWGYPEPYTRDLLISSLGILASGNEELLRSLRRVLETLARNQSPRGQIPSLVHDPEDRGASDTTPLFLLVLGLFRRFTGRRGLPGGGRSKGPPVDGLPDHRRPGAGRPTAHERLAGRAVGPGLRALRQHPRVRLPEGPGPGGPGGGPADGREP